MDVEDHFGIAIQNTEAEHVRTVGDLVSLIRSRIQAAHLASCPTLKSFLQLRSCVRELATNQTLRIRSRTRVVDVLNPTQRRRLWKRLTDILGSAPPSLRRHPTLRKVLVVLVCTAIVLAVTVAAAVDIEILPLTLVLAAVATLILHLATVRFRTYPPDTLTTFGAVARRMTGITAATKQLHLDSDHAILDELRPIVVDTLGVDGSEVVLTARFIEDLGMG
ncbi:acyl carrier protein [Stieleria varia]|uniref:Acyl carrier protein n=2 Tax=Stieleria varia TaxID=2528005 RepID=A0A5C6B8Z1_9BACT|nr:acyl carrier protein [Stieleria varia]